MTAKAKVQKAYEYTLELRPLYHEVEVKVRCEKFPWLHDTYRLVLQNGKEVAMARPAMGSFNLGYNWMAVFPLYGAGPAKVRNAIQDRLNHGGFHGFCNTLDIAIEIVCRAIKMLREVD